jgi:hypothetical protein
MGADEDFDSFLREWTNATDDFLEKRDQQHMAEGHAVEFETFLRDWAKKRIWAIGDFLDKRDRQYMVERRAVELIRLAQETGFGDDLADKVRRHGSLLQYVKHLMWDAYYQASQDHTMK